VSENVAHPAPPREYTVHLEAFEGPLDLLLFLIRRAEVEITDIPIAVITEQYLAYLEHQVGSGPGARIDIEDAGEFLVMAATLMEIKSRMLAPPAAAAAGQAPGDHPGPVVDPRADLVRQLLEYKRYRDATEQLERFRKEWESRFPAARAARPALEQSAVDDDAPVELDDIELIDLVEAFSRVIETVDLARVGEHHVKMDETPVELHAEDIVDRLRRFAETPAQAFPGLAAGEMPFTEVFRGRSRPEAIGLFLALLELVKQQRVAVHADASGSGIVLALKHPDAPAEPDPLQNPARAL
jgi:segregation and condensation protein A